VGIGVPYVPVTIFCVTLLFLASLFALSWSGRCGPVFSSLLFGGFLLGVVSAALAQIQTGSMTLPRAAGPGKVTVIGEVAEPVRYGPDVSVGMGKSYGHPTPAMLETYARLGIRVLRTDYDGAVTVIGTPLGMEFS